MMNIGDRGQSHFTVGHFAVTDRAAVSNQGAPESVLERCSHIRVGGSASVPLTPAVREQLLSTLRDWGSGRDTLRCLAMATRDAPPDLRCLNLENTASFVNHEVRAGEVGSAVLVHGADPVRLVCFTPV